MAIYPNDHRPAHVHVHVHAIGDGCEAVFNLNYLDGSPETAGELWFCSSQAQTHQGGAHARINKLLHGMEQDSWLTLKQKSQQLTNEPRNRLAKTPTATAARYDRRIGRLVIDLSSGLSIAFKPGDAQGLERAKPEQMTKIEISPSGLGLHFPAIDADIYLPGLLEGFLGSRGWMAAQLGKAGGSAKSDAKAIAVRANGRLGG